MSHSEEIEKLIAVLRELGIRTLDDRLVDGQSGFPVSVPLQGGGSLVLDLPTPGVLTSLDPERIGVAILDPLGYVRRLWGVARRVPHFKMGRSMLSTPLGGLLEGSYQGAHGSVFLDGFRYFSASLSNEELNDVFVLVLNAQEERLALRDAGKNAQMAQALKKLGKALTMNQQIHPLCNAAAHEIASVAELAGVLIWVNRDEDESLELVSSVGINRQGQSVLSRVAPHNMATCAADLVAASRTPFVQSNVLDHMLTANLEARCCYLRPGGVSVQPLVISDKLVGVIELVGRDGDSNFEEHQELFETIAEHLALAINSALLFENFERWASHDALTGLANHRSLHDFLHQRTIEAKRTGQEIGVIMMDVDHFRSFNEEEGHDAGDEVLRQVSEAIKVCLRPYDLAARYGGEEFAVIMPGCNLENTRLTAERVRAKVESQPYITRAGREKYVTVSLGCAVFPLTSTEPAGLLKAADIALYQAKRGGRNRTAVYDGTFVDKGAARQLHLERVEALLPPSELISAMDRRERLADEVDELAKALNLSHSQVEILRALLLVAPYYLKLQEQEDLATLSEIESAEEFRLLLPSLHALGERFDGTGKTTAKGSRIPLLGRVLTVVLALERDGGRDLVEDPGRFDPEVVDLLLDLRHAA